ncbi:hypothetical protein V9T40_006958 [Parthenolecanium corni]|uniref:Uncharacterized protein n=1 Tax=Parthenolecanium corni TaxID=536013 RepID=A0AAN9TU26_9HEMI
MSCSKHPRTIIEIHESNGRLTRQLLEARYYTVQATNGSQSCIHAAAESKVHDRCVGAATLEIVSHYAPAPRLIRRPLMINNSFQPYRLYEYGDDSPRTREHR